MKKRNILLIIFVCLSTISFSQPLDEMRLKYNNPDLTVDLGVGLWGTPIPMDFDNDGLMDILMSCRDVPYRGVYFFRNIGTKEKPFFTKAQKLSSKAYFSTQTSYADGKTFVISAGKEFKNFKVNILDNPIEIEVDIKPGHNFKKTRSNMWSYVDYDGDGDLDIVVGIDTWDDYGWDNAYNEKGEWTKGPLRGYMYLLENINGKYVNKGRIKAGYKELETYGAPGANVADFDGDGDLDIICGEFLDKITWFRNIGSRKKPKYAEGKILLDEDDDTIRMHVEMIVPVACDFNQDGHIDLIVGDEDGRVVFIKNTGKVKKGMPIFKKPIYLKQIADNVKFGALSAPCSVDWDGDGYEDIISGNSAGNIAFIKNINGAIPPKWDVPVYLKANGKDIRIMAGKNMSIQGPAEEKWGYTTISVADWDGDGIKDIIINSILGKIMWYKGTDDPYTLQGPFNVKVNWGNSVPPKPQWNWWNPGKTDLVTQWRTTPVAIDWNKDGLTDLIVMDHEGYLAYFERFESNGELWLKPGKRIFYIEDMSQYDHNNKLTGTEVRPLRLNSGSAGSSGRRKICMVDWNNDGRIDLLVNSNNVCLFENVREEDDRVYFVNKGNINQTNLAGHDTCPTPVDWDKDGIYDLIVGGEDGHFYWMKNTK